ncbi:hypothetical protein HPB51_021580 [Rhipicephalus microplus]|uniref:Uncharacterized protein n=1 Tax=Rhipicephalus microplus TaxID=6941 RepID=A0A9J6DC92_RHIMP|nr:hypothetical protein HPB51_021580 [Rhipicephalus microplus]
MSTLSGSDRQRYGEKIELCGVNPFSPGVRYVANFDLWPHVDKRDISDFLVLRTSFATRKQLKAYKSMEGHNYVTSGWVQEPLLTQVNVDTVFVITQVNHSQSLSAPPVKAWILSKSDGEVVAAHCLRMASNVEACSHVAALLFYLEYGVRA